MTGREPEPTLDTVCFDGFTLVAAQRLLTKDGVPVRLGSRAFDILLALVSRAGQAVDNTTLMAEVWPNVTVNKGSLRFHIAGLRKALGDGEEGARYVTTLAGRGYCFVAEISRSGTTRALEASRLPAAKKVGEFLGATLPSRIGKVIGRDDETAAILALLTASRFVTIVGPGGVGKTTVAIELGRNLLRTFGDAVFFVELGTLRDPALVGASLAATLGLSSQADDPTLSLISFLQERRCCVILDNCEHLVEVVSALAGRVFAAAPNAYLLATSREALRVEGEHVYRLGPLVSPPDERDLTAAAALTFSAPQLFMERVSALGIPLEITDTSARLVADICRKLDGVPLAIELAASRVEAYELGYISKLLDERLNLSWSGQRGVQARHQTLQATLDWSYDLLTDLEQTVLRRLSVFVGHFTLAAARAVAPDAAVNEVAVLGAVASLVAKSLVATDRTGSELHYRLLDTTRVYANEKLLMEDGAGDVAKRHAGYYGRWLEDMVATSAAANAPINRTERTANLGNIQAALQWSFSAGSDPAGFVRLASAAMPFFFALSLLTEVHRWSARALTRLDVLDRGGQYEMRIQGAYGLSIVFLKGGGEDARIAFERALQIAEDLGDGVSQLDLLARLHIFHERVCEFRVAMTYAERCMTVARTVDDPDGVAAAQALAGVSHHQMGNYNIAQVQLETALRTPRSLNKTSAVYFGFDHRTRVRICLARNLWLQGRPREAAEAAYDAIDEATSTAHPVTLCVALLWSACVFLWIGDLDSAEAHLDRFIAQADFHSLKPYQIAGRGMKAELDIRRGNIERGVGALRDSLEELYAAQYHFLTTPFNTVLAEGLAASKRETEAMRVIETTILSVERNGDLYIMPELLRVRAKVRLAGSLPDLQAAEADLVSSLEYSRRQGARSWELRTAIDLARLWADRGDTEQARSLLTPLLQQVGKGFRTADGASGEELLKTLPGSTSIAPPAANSRTSRKRPPSR